MTVSRGNGEGGVGGKAASTFYKSQAYKLSKINLVQFYISNMNMNPSNRRSKMTA